MSARKGKAMPKAKPMQPDPTVKSTDCVVNYPAALCRQFKSKFDDSVFRSISIRLKDGSWGTFTLSESAVRPAVRRNGELIPNKVTLYLGDSEDVRFVSVRSGDMSWERKPYFNRSLKQLINNDAKSFLRSIAS